MGLLDSFTNWAQSGTGQSQPVADGLLAAGLGILANNRGLTSGSQAVGLGGLQGLDQYQRSKQYTMQQQLQNAQLQQLGFGLKQKQMLFDLAKNYLGDQPGATATAGGPATPNPAADVGGAPAEAGASGAPAAPMPVSMQSGGPGLSGAPMQAAPQGGGSAGGIFGNMPRGLVAYGLLNDPGKLFENAAAQYAPTDIQKQLVAAGYQPGSPEYKAALDATIKKAGHIAPVSLRPGGFSQDADGTITALPSAAPEGYENISDGKGGWRVQQVPGGPEAVAGYNRMKASGSAGYQLTEVYDPNANGGRGGMVRQTVANVADAAGGNAPAPLRNNNPGALMPGGKLAQYPDVQTGLAALDKNLQSYGNQGINTISGVISKWAPPNENDTQAYIKDVSQRLGIPPNQKIDLSNPLHRQALSTAITLHENGPSGVFGSQQQAPARQSGAFAAAPPTGYVKSTEAGAVNQQDELSANWKNLTEQNRQAQTTNSYLQSIKGLASKAATGQQADRLNYVNGLLSLAGSDKATDAVTANNLLDKYSNQIVARLGQGGLGTDAARSILQSAYPNAHMTPQAIHEAADNLIGANQMTQAKTRLLAPLANARNPTEYNNAEMKFDQNADPRIFQYAGITDPAARQAFAKKLMQQDPKIVDKIKALQAMGAF